MLENDNTFTKFIDPNKANETNEINEINETQINQDKKLELEQSAEVIDQIVEDKPAPFVEVVIAVEEIADVSLSDENSLPSSYSESYTTENELEQQGNQAIEDAPKKKRAYKPRKKKTDL